MDKTLFLQQLGDLPLEEGRTYIQTHAASLSDQADFSILLKDEALRLQNSDPFLSLKLAELLIFFGQHTRQPASHALGLIAKGNALASIGYHQSAVEALDAAGDEFLQLGDEVGWARSRVMWIYSCAFLGHTQEALQGAAEARAAFARHGEYGRACLVDHNTAIIYTQTGQYQQALDIYTQLQDVYPTLTDQNADFIKNAIALAQYNQARNLSWLGNFERAYALLHEARESFIELHEVGRVLDVEINLADFDYAQGYFGSALRRYYQIRDGLVENKLGDPIRLSWITLKIATCLTKLNRADEACQLAARAVEVQRSCDSLLGIADSLREVAAMLATAHRHQEALTALAEAESLFTQGNLEHQASVTRLQQAELLLEMGSALEAYEQARRVKTYFDARGLVDRSARSSLVMAGALIAYARRTAPALENVQQARLLQEAATICTHTVALARQHNLQELVYKCQHLLGHIANLQQNPEKARRHFSSAIAQIERMLHDLAYDLGPAFLRTTWTVYEDLIALYLQMGKVEHAFTSLERARSMALRQYLNQLRRPTAQAAAESNHEIAFPPAMQENSAAILRTRHDLEIWQERHHQYSTLLADFATQPSPAGDQAVIQAELKRCEEKLNELFERLHLHQGEQSTTSQRRSPKTASTRKRSRALSYPEPQQLRRHLLPDQLLLAYYLYQGRLVIFALTAEHTITHELPEGAAQLERLLLLLHAHLQPGTWPDIQNPPQQVIRRLLQKMYALLIAPIASLLPPRSGYLTIVPYGPLHKLPFHALYDGSHFLVEDFQVNYLPASSILTRIGGDQIETNAVPLLQQESQRSPLVFGYSGHGHLQQALEEARSLASTLDGRCYLEEEATIARLIEQAPGSPIIHLATHGHSRMDDPNFSYVRLADGQLNAIDAFSLDLRGCKLVTLSGCETGLALSGGGDEQLGLGRAFLAAGAASLVMSLWPVEDDATKTLMQFFYQHLLAGDSKVQALRAAQCALLHGTTPAHTHPYFWASFRLVGDAGRLR